MSFILDALRKSEHERERRALPALVERGAGSAPSRSSRVLVALGVLLLANLVLLGFFLSRPAVSPPAPAHVAAPARVVPPPPAAAAAPTRPLAAEAGDAEPEAAAEPEPRALARAEPELAAPPLVRARRAAAPAATAAGESAPTLNELPDTASGLPHLSLELHVYASTPADRFVVLNGQRLREGGVLREGPVLERITTDGVILNYRGTRFLLPRQ